MPVISGGGAAFNGGTLHGVVVIDAPEGSGGADDTALTLRAANSSNDALLLYENPTTTSPSLQLRWDGKVLLNTVLGRNPQLLMSDSIGGTQVDLDPAGNGNRFLAGIVLAAHGIQTGQQASGALPTVQLVTATGAQIDTASDRETITPCTFNPGVATTATITVALSPDNVTYSTLGIETEPVGTVLDGTIHLVKVRVPAGWYLKLTANAQASLGLTTYY